MKKANLVLMAALAAAGLVGVAGGSLLPVSAAVAAEKEKPAAKQKLSPAVQKPLVAAQNAMTAKNWDEAMVQIQAAQAVEEQAAGQPLDEHRFAAAEVPDEGENHRGVDASAAALPRPAGFLLAAAFEGEACGGG